MSCQNSTRYRGSKQRYRGLAKEDSRNGRHTKIIKHYAKYSALNHVSSQPDEEVVLVPVAIYTDYEFMVAVYQATMPEKVLIDTDSDPI